MEPTTVGQPASAPVVTAENGTRQLAPVSDLAIAGAVAGAVRAMPEVVDLSPGITMLAATYGAGQRVTGVVVHHIAPDTLVLEVHVVLSEEHCRAATTSRASDAAVHRPGEIGLLIDAANRIREAVHAVVHDTTSLPLEQVDVLIDDLR